MQNIEGDIHGPFPSPGSANSGPILKRKRTTYSCQNCRKKKIKCDTSRPCGACKLVGAACNYPDQTSSEIQASSTSEYTFDLRTRLDTLEYKIDCLLSSPKNKIAPARQDIGLLEYSTSQDTRSSEEIQEHDVFSWPAIRSFLTAAELARATHGNFLSSYEQRTWNTQSEHLPEIEDGRIIDILLEIFYRQVHIKHPLFELDFARRCREQNYKIGYDHLGATVSIMMALGSLVAEGGQIYLRDYRQQCIAMAERRLPLSLLGMTLDNVRTLYLYGMLQLYLFRWWPYVQMVNLAASKMAMLHKLGHSTFAVDTIAPLEQRLYWSCLKVQPCSNIYS